eukprot:Clim_evm1s200 gene=Clim_evmTU1s200
MNFGAANSPPVDDDFYLQMINEGQSGSQAPPGTDFAMDVASFLNDVLLPADIPDNALYPNSQFHQNTEGGVHFGSGSEGGFDFNSPSFQQSEFSPGSMPQPDQRPFFQDQRHFNQMKPEMMGHPGMHTGAQQDEISAEDRKRLNHVASEQKRRDNIKDGFKCLADALPHLKEGTSRSVMLKKAVEYIDHVKKQNREIAQLLYQQQGAGASVKGPQRQIGIGSPGSDLVEGDEVSYAALMEAIERRLNIHNTQDQRNIFLMFKDEKVYDDITSQEDLYEKFRKVAAEGKEEMKIGVYVRKEGAPKDAMPTLDHTAVDAELLMESHVPEAESEVEDFPDAAFSDVNEKALEMLFAKFENDPRSMLGGKAYQNPLWRKGRVARFLKVCRNDVKKTAKMMNAHFDWLQAYNPEAVSIHDVANEVRDNKAFFHGRDREGRPIIIFRAKKHFVKNRDKYESIRMWVYMVQQFIDHYQRDPEQNVVVIYDRREASKPNSDPAVFKKLAQIVQYNYPNIMHRMYVIEPDYVFQYSFSIVKLLTAKTFHKRVLLLGKNWMETLKKFIDPTNLPKDMGGLSEYEYRYDPDDESHTLGIVDG